MNDEASRIYGIRSVARQIQSSLKKFTSSQAARADANS